MRIAFVGTVKSSYELLSALLDNRFEIAGVITRMSSSYNADFEDLTPLCRSHGVPYLQVNKINSKEAYRFLEEIQADVMYCFGWSEIIKEDVFGIMNDNIYGFHPTLLPRNRGRHPIIWALVLGLEETGVTFFRMDQGCDSGDIASQKSIRIDYEDTAETLYHKILDSAKKQLIEMTSKMIKNELVLVKQNELEATYWRKRTKADGCIDFRMGSRQVYNLVRALSKPYSGAHLNLDGMDYKVWNIDEIDCSGLDNIEPGKVIEINENGMKVKCGDGAVILKDYDHMPVEEGDYL